MLINGEPSFYSINAQQELMNYRSTGDCRVVGNAAVALVAAAEQDAVTPVTEEAKGAANGLEA